MEINGQEARMTAQTITCPACNEELMRLESDVDGSVELVCMTHGAVTDPGFRLITGDGLANFPALNAAGEVLCPCCAHADVAMFAHDGEADLADWWACEKFSGGCGSHGCVTSVEDTTVTQNGIVIFDGLG